MLRAIKERDYLKNEIFKGNRKKISFLRGRLQGIKVTMLTEIR